MIPIAIVAHPARQQQALELAKEAKAGAVFWDHDSQGATHNHLQAWRWLANSGASHGVVLEDDVELAPNFHNQLPAAIMYAPSDFLSLYLGRGRPQQYQERIGAAITKHASFITHGALLSAQGYVMPTRYFDSYNRVHYHRAPIDIAISRWLEHRRVSYCRQSLVDHLDGPTLIADHGDGQPRNGKTALWTEDCDPSGKDEPEIRKAWLMASHTTDWTKGSVAL